jgi:hypothetical protein
VGREAEKEGEARQRLRQKSLQCEAVLGGSGNWAVFVEVDMSHNPKHDLPAHTKEKGHASPPAVITPSAAGAPRLRRNGRKWSAWLGGSAIALVTLVVSIFPTESHDMALDMLHSPVSLWNFVTNKKLGPWEATTLRADQLKRYTTFNVAGSFQQGYSISKDSTVVVDGETGQEMDADITIVGPNNSQETFTAKPSYQKENIWQWQGQGTLHGSLDFQNYPRSFAGYAGGKPLTNSTYFTPGVAANLTSSNTVLRPIATSDRYP